MNCLEQQVHPDCSDRQAEILPGCWFPDDSHLTHLSREVDESLQVAAAFVLEGLRREDTVCIVATEEKAISILQEIDRKGVSTGDLLLGGSLHLNQGLDSPERQENYLLTLAGQNPGHFRVFGEMSWVLAKGWTFEQLELLERSISFPGRAEGGMFLCQYQLDKFGSREIMMALETHPHCLYRGKIQQNPYFEQ